MKQKYKVFLSETEIVFEPGHNVDSEDEISFTKEEVIGLLEKTLPPSKVSIQSKNPTQSIQKFSSLFQKIDAAGGVVVHQQTKKILLIFRNGVWDFPKGKVDAGELPETTAVREVEEECGITGLSVLNPLGATFHGYMFNGEPTLKTTYWYLMNCSGNQDPIGQQEEGITEVRWVTPDQVGTLLSKSYRSIKELWEGFMSSDQDTP